jgi:hypothetical protein
MDSTSERRNGRDEKRFPSQHRPQRWHRVERGIRASTLGWGLDILG